MIDSVNANHRLADEKAQEQLEKLRAEQKKRLEDFQVQSRQARKRHARRFIVHALLALAVQIACASLLRLFPSYAELIHTMIGFNLAALAYHAGIIAEAARWWSRG